MVSIKKWVIGSLTAGVLAATTAGVTPAWADTTPGHLVAGPMAVRSAVAKPNSDIAGAGKTVKFSPASLKAKWSGPTQKKCTTAKASFTITNKAKTAEQVTYQGAAFGKPVAAGKILYVCGWGSGSASPVFGLKANKKAKLTVAFS